MQRSRLCCKRLDLFTKLENLEASRWGSSQDCQGVFIAAISSLNNCFWLDHYGGAVFKGESFGFVRRKKLEQIIAFKESNFVNVYVFFLFLPNEISPDEHSIFVSQLCYIPNPPLFQLVYEECSHLNFCQDLFFKYLSGITKSSKAKKTLDSKINYFVQLLYLNQLIKDFISSVIEVKSAYLPCLCWKVFTIAILLNTLISIKNYAKSCRKKFIQCLSPHAS